MMNLVSNVFLSAIHYIIVIIIKINDPELSLLLDEIQFTMGLVWTGFEL